MTRSVSTWSDIRTNVKSSKAEIIVLSRHLTGTGRLGLLCWHCNHYRGFERRTCLLDSDNLVKNRFRESWIVLIVDICWYAEHFQPKSAIERSFPHFKGQSIISCVALPFQAIQDKLLSLPGMPRSAQQNKSNVTSNNVTWLNLDTLQTK